MNGKDKTQQLEEPVEIKEVLGWSSSGEEKVPPSLRFLWEKTSCHTGKNIYLTEYYPTEYLPNC